MKKRNQVNTKPEKYVYYYFSSSSFLSCDSLKTFLEDQIGASVDCVFSSVEGATSHTSKTGYLRIISQWEVKKIRVGEVSIDLERTSRDHFERNLQTRIKEKRQRSEGLEGDEINFASASLQCINSGEITKTRPQQKYKESRVNQGTHEEFKLTGPRDQVEGKVLEQPSTPENSENFNSKADHKKILREKSGRTKHGTVFEENKPWTTKPSLNFNRHFFHSKKDHAFNGYFIRPYLRYLKTISANTGDSSNIRLNIFANDPSKASFSKRHSTHDSSKIVQKPSNHQDNPSAR